MAAACAEAAALRILNPCVESPCDGPECALLDTLSKEITISLANTAGPIIFGTDDFVPNSVGTPTMAEAQMTAAYTIDWDGDELVWSGSISAIGQGSDWEYSLRISGPTFFTVAVDGVWPGTVNTPSTLFGVEIEEATKVFMSGDGSTASGGVVQLRWPAQSLMNLLANVSVGSTLSMRIAVVINASKTPSGVRNWTTPIIFVPMTSSVTTGSNPVGYGNLGTLALVSTENNPGPPVLCGTADEISLRVLQNKYNVRCLLEGGTYLFSTRMGKRPIGSSEPYTYLNENWIYQDEDLQVVLTGTGEGNNVEVGFLPDLTLFPEGQNPEIYNGFEFTMADCSIVEIISPPTNLVATAGVGLINVSWDLGEASYDEIYLERSLDGLSFSPLITLGGSTTSHDDTTASDDVEYWYRARGKLNGEFSAYSNIDSATIVVDSCPGGYLIENAGSPYPSEAAAQAALDDPLQVASCMLYANPLVGIPNSLTASFVSSLSISASKTGVNSQTFQLAGSINLGAGDTLSIDYLCALSGGTGGGFTSLGITIANCLNETLDNVSLFEPDDSISGTYTFPVPTTGEYYFRITASASRNTPQSNTNTTTATISSSGSISTNPIIAVYDDGGGETLLPCTP